ncbi:MAG: rod-binding protein [Rhodobacteraceae bacterium]|nr:rod-binding protein [Paracoccaceae bacterium]
MPQPILSGAFSTPQSRSDTQTETALRRASQQLEAQFLAEMLKSTGLEGSEGAFGGGSGEEQFQSFLRDAQADRMVQAGGIGLAEHIFQALTRRAQ